MSRFEELSQTPEEPTPTQPTLFDQPTSVKMVDPNRYTTEQVWNLVNGVKFYGTRQDAERIRERPDYDPNEETREVLAFARYVSRELAAKQVRPTFDIVSTSNAKDIGSSRKFFRKVILGTYKPPVQYSEQPLDTGWLVSASTEDKREDVREARYHAIDGTFRGIYLSSTGKGLMKFIGHKDGLDQTQDLSQTGFAEIDGPDGADTHVTLRAQGAKVEPLTDKDKLYEPLDGNIVGKVALHMEYSQPSVSRFLVDIAVANKISLAGW